MANFDNFQDTLPNPSNGIAYDGSDTSGNAGYAVGPGYATVKVDSKFKTSRDITNSGVLVSRNKAAQSFEVNITYNPMTEEEFMPVYTFLMEKQGMLKPFFIPLPQYDNPNDSTLAGNSPLFDFSPTTGLNAGVTKMIVSGGVTYNSSTDGTLRPGDVFTINDTNDTNHKKMYKITRVEVLNSSQNGETGLSSTQMRLHFSPPLQKAVDSSATLVYNNPKIKATLKTDVISYNLGTDNLYKYSLSAMEVQ